MLLERSQQDRDELVRSNIRLIRFVQGQRFRNAPTNRWDELESAGHLGLMDAARTYDPARSEFTTYAMVCITKRMRHVLRPTVYRKRICNAPTFVKAAPDRRHPNPSDEAARREAVALLRRAMLSLPDRDRLIITARFGLDGAPPATHESAGARVGLSRTRVQQLEPNLLRVLRCRLAAVEGGAR